MSRGSESDVSFPLPGGWGFMVEPAPEDSDAYGMHSRYGQQRCIQADIEYSGNRHEKVMIRTGRMYRLRERCVAVVVTPLAPELATLTSQWRWTVLDDPAEDERQVTPPVGRWVEIFREPLSSFLEQSAAEYLFDAGLGLWTSDPSVDIYPVNLDGASAVLFSVYAGDEGLTGTDPTLAANLYVPVSDEADADTFETFSMGTSNNYVGGGAAGYILLGQGIQARDDTYMRSRGLLFQHVKPKLVTTGSGIEAPADAFVRLAVKVP